MPKSLKQQKPTTWHPVSGSGDPASTLGAVDDYAWNAVGAVYRKTATSTWTLVSFGYRLDTAGPPMGNFVARGFGTPSSTSKGVYTPPATSSSEWVKTGLAAQSGTAITMAGGSGARSAKLLIGQRTILGTASFTVGIMPVGADVQFGMGTGYIGVVPLVNVTPAGVATLRTAGGGVIKTFSGTVVGNDSFTVQMIGATTLVAYIKGAALQDFALFPTMALGSQTFRHGADAYETVIYVAGSSGITAGYIAMDTELFAL